MSRAKKGAASEDQVPSQQEEAAVNPLLIEQLRELLKEMKEETIKESNEDNTKLSDRLQALELKQQRSPVGNAGSHEEKSGKRDNHAPEAGGKETTPPEQQLRQATSSSYGPSPFYQLEQP